MILLVKWCNGVLFFTLAQVGGGILTVVLRCLQSET